MIVKHPREYVVDKLQYALNPKTIAVVGASRYSTKVGYKVVDGLLTWGYKGIKCTLCQGHYDFFLFRFLLYICLLCRGIKVMPLIDCFHLLL